jgi:hypothetical protein
MLRADTWQTIQGDMLALPPNRSCMKHRKGVALAASLAAWVIVVSGCNGRFDFDTEVDAAIYDPVDADSDQGAPSANPDDSQASAPEADVTPFVGQVHCGVDTCNAPTQHCCVDATGSHCVDALAACSGLSIPCDDPSDCPSGKGCCSEARSGRVAQVECEDPTSCLSKGHVLLCSPADPSVCNGGACVSTTQPPLPTDYHQCN